MKDYIKPTLVLGIICLVITAFLAATYNVTQPIIEENNRKAAEESRAMVLTSADGFEEVTGDFPANTVDVYKASNGAGFAITTTAKGYDSDPLKVMVGIKADGTVEKINVLSNTETPGLGSKVSEDSFTNQVIGMDNSMSGYEMIAGATKSSNAIKNCVLTAFEVYDMVKGE